MPSLITEFLCCLRGWALLQWLWSILNDSVKGFTRIKYWNCCSARLYRAAERVQLMRQQLTPRLLWFTLTAVMKSYPDATGWCFQQNSSNQLCTLPAQHQTDEHRAATSRLAPLYRSVSLFFPVSRSSSQTDRQTAWLSEDTDLIPGMMLSNCRPITALRNQTVGGEMGHVGKQLFLSALACFSNNMSTRATFICFLSISLVALMS